MRQKVYILLASSRWIQRYPKFNAFIILSCLILFGLSIDWISKEVQWLLSLDSQWEFQHPKNGGTKVLYHIRPYFGEMFPYRSLMVGTSNQCCISGELLMGDLLGASWITTGYSVCSSPLCFFLIFCSDATKNQTNIYVYVYIIYVCIYVNIYIYMHVFLHIHTHAHTHIYIYIHTCVWFKKNTCKLYMSWGSGLGYWACEESCFVWYMSTPAFQHPLIDLRKVPPYFIELHRNVSIKHAGKFSPANHVCFLETSWIRNLCRIGGQQPFFLDMFNIFPEIQSWWKP